MCRGLPFPAGRWNDRQHLAKLVERRAIGQGGVDHAILF
jgi:hypothetical protein